MSQQGQYPVRKRLGAGWIIGGVTGTLAVLIAVAATLTATGIFGNASQTPGSNSTASHRDKSTGEYAFVENMCSEMDVAPLEALAPLDGDIEQDTEKNEDDESHSVCTASFAEKTSRTEGSLYASATRWETAAAAKKDAATAREPDPVDGEMALSDLTGDWDFGNIAKKFYPSTGAVRVSVLIQDGNFTAIAQATFTKFDGEISEAKLEAAAVDTAIGILKLSRA